MEQGLDRHGMIGKPCPHRGGERLHRLSESVIQEDTDANTASNVVNIRIDGAKPQVSTVVSLSIFEATRSIGLWCGVFGHDL